MLFDSFFFKLNFPEFGNPVQRFPGIANTRKIAISREISRPGNSREKAYWWHWEKSGSGIETADIGSGNQSLWSRYHDLQKQCINARVANSFWALRLGSCSRFPKSFWRVFFCSDHIFECTSHKKKWQKNVFWHSFFFLVILSKRQLTFWLNPLPPIWRPADVRVRTPSLPKVRQLIYGWPLIV